MIVFGWSPKIKACNHIDIIQGTTFPTFRIISRLILDLWRPCDPVFFSPLEGPSMWTPWNSSSWKNNLGNWFYQDSSGKVNSKLTIKSPSSQLRMYPELGQRMIPYVAATNQWSVAKPSCQGGRKQQKTHQDRAARAHHHLRSPWHSQTMEIEWVRQHLRRTRG